LAVFYAIKPGLLLLTVLHAGEDTGAFRTADTLAIYALPAIAARCTVIN
jgi:hypothetical protein